MPPLAARVRALCQSHLADPAFGVGRIADALGVSDRHVRRLLVAEIGEGPQALLRRLRIERAQDLLRGGATVRTVARAVGYRDVAAFRRSFRAVTGRAPRGQGEDA